MGNLGEEITSMEIHEMIANIRELLGAIFIQEQRNYDMLLMIADNLGSDTDKMIEMHAKGQVLAPAPSFIFEEEDDTTTN
jgi:hypothetical protein